ncbi:MAG: hypothetical protein JRI23_15185 [Deltaproteobacteria bacterium]|jgi:hypothetical protein|nr:hypothetical protein [Deltaproteobacteria bacterium]MBW2533092.1 hypothetical protein [Deltaproteobacteria bacterium]
MPDQADEYLDEIRRQGERRELFFKLHVVAAVAAFAGAFGVSLAGYHELWSPVLGGCCIVAGVLAVLARRSIARGVIGRFRAPKGGTVAGVEEGSHEQETRGATEGVMLTLVGLLLLAVGLYQLLG